MPILTPRLPQGGVCAQYSLGKIKPFPQSHTLHQHLLIQPKILTLHKATELTPIKRGLMNGRGGSAAFLRLQHPDESEHNSEMP